MRNVAAAFVVLTALLLFGCCATTPTLPPGANIIDSCPYRINQTGHYYLASDLYMTSYGVGHTTSSYDNCISISDTANGATLDCLGHSITCDGADCGTGISIAASGVTVKNCSVSGFSKGISLGSSGNNITGNNASSNDVCGIYLSHSNNNNLTGNTANSNRQYGISLYESSNNNLTGNDVHSNRYYGVVLDHSGGNSFTSNIITGNIVTADRAGDFYCSDQSPNLDNGNTCGTQTGCDTSFGGWLTSCPPGAPTSRPTPPPSCASQGETLITACGTTISNPGSYVLCGNLTSARSCIAIESNDVILDCLGHSITCDGSACATGIYIHHASGVTVKNCSVSGFSDGIHLGSSSNNNIVGNNASSSSRFGRGIYLSDSNNNNLTNNTANSNQEEGIYLLSSDSNNITNNTANSNIYRGISLYESSRNNIASNTANSNKYGIQLYRSSSNSFTDNIATANREGDFYCHDQSPNFDNSNTCSAADSCSWLTCH